MISKLLGLVLLTPTLALRGPAAEPPAAPARTTPPEFDASLQPREGLLRIAYRNRPLLAYAFATNQFKPYLRELHSLSGENVLFDAPPDHLHHHGLMYAIRVNGINFWEEQVHPGHQRSVRVEPPRLAWSSAGLPQAAFTQWIHWLAPSNAAAVDSESVALLIEKRTLTVTIDEKPKEVALTWRSEFEVGPHVVQATLTGSPYFGLGMRFPPPYNRIARHQNSENAPYVTEGRGDVIPARWSAVSHPVQGHPMVALFGRKSDRGWPIYFTMTEPFTYLSATQGLDQKPIEYPAGASFSLEYLLTVYSDTVTPAFLDQRHRLWTR